MAATAVVVFALAGAAVPALGAGKVIDNAKVVSADAAKKAEQAIGQIKERHGVDLLIQTEPAIPDDLQDLSQQLAKDEFFKHWARGRAEAAGVDGIVVLICMKPGRFQVEVIKRVGKPRFTPRDLEELIAGATPLMGEKKYDEAIVRSANFILKRMDFNTGGGGGPATKPSASKPS